MKELIHFTYHGSVACESMKPVIEDFITKNPETKYSLVDVTQNPTIFEYYVKKYNLPFEFPIFVGLVDGVMQDGTIGTATEMILESLVN